MAYLAVVALIWRCVQDLGWKEEALAWLCVLAVPALKICGTVLMVAPLMAMVDKIEPGSLDNPDVSARFEAALAELVRVDVFGLSLSLTNYIWGMVLILAVVAVMVLAWELAKRRSNPRELL